MKKNKLLLTGMLALTLAFGLILTGCVDLFGDDDDDYYNDGDDHYNGTEEKTLVITDITAVQASQGSRIQIGIYIIGTTPEDALAQMYLVAEADSYEGDVTLSGSTATVQLYDLHHGDRWTGSGTYDVYLIVGSGSSPDYYRKKSVSFTTPPLNIGFRNKFLTGIAFRQQRL